MWKKTGTAVDDHKLLSTARCWKKTNLSWMTDDCELISLLSLLASLLAVHSAHSSLAHILSDIQKADRAETSASLLSLFNEHPDNFISWFVSGFITSILKVRVKSLETCQETSTSHKVTCGNVSLQSYGRRIL